MIKKELLAGLTTFATLFYIAIVNPALLSQAGMDEGAVMTATLITACLSTLWTGLVAGYPFALAPGMGLNAYFTYSLVLGSHVSWQTALGTCFIAGLILILLTLLGVRKQLIQAIPPPLQVGVMGGIGLFIAFIGLQSMGLVVAHPSTCVALGSLKTGPALIGGGGLILLMALLTRSVPGATLWALGAMWIISLATGHAQWQGTVALPPSLSPTWGQLDIQGALDPHLWSAIFAFVFVILMDATGTLIALANQGGFLDSKGHLPRANRALMGDALGTTFGAIAGTSPVATYLESAAGIAAGGRTGWTAITVAGLLFLSLFLSPIVKSFPLFATAPVLIVIGGLMLQSVKSLNWEDPSDFLPAFIVLLTIPLTYSIATGISLGFVVYPLCKLLSGKGSEVPWLTWGVGIFFLIHLLYA